MKATHGRKVKSRNPRKKRRPLSRRGGRIYWKGRPVDDDLFTNEQRVEYNAFIRKLRRKKKTKKIAKACPLGSSTIQIT